MERVAREFVPLRKLTGSINLFTSLLFVDQHILLPFARFLVGAVNTAYPTAGPFLTFEKLLYSPLDPLYASLFLLCIFNPTNKFVSRDRRQVFPEACNFF